MPTKSSTLRSSLLMAVAFAFLSTGAWAETTGRPDNTPAFSKLSDEAVTQFKGNPLALLTTYASAGLPLTTQVRSLLLSDPALVDILIETAKSANDAQKAAIGAGLAQATRILAHGNPQIAATVQQKVAASGLLPLITAFITGSNGIETAAVGGGGGGGGGGTGPTGGVNAEGGNGGGHSGTAPNGSLVTSNLFTGNSAPGASGFAQGASGGGVTTTIFSVSPTH
jgi:hypothetical protein